VPDCPCPGEAKANIGSAASSHGETETDGETDGLGVVGDGVVGVGVGVLDVGLVLGETLGVVELD